MTKTERNDLAYWFPILESTGVPVPKTTILKTDVNLELLTDGEMPEGYEGFIRELKDACEAMGYPVFLRTGHTSAKHEWKRTCFLAHDYEIRHNVYNLIEFSMLADIMGLPTSTWVVREFLELEHYFTAFSGQMPIAREYRCFFRDGEILCIHPYWPPGSIQSPSSRDWVNDLEFINQMGSTTRMNLGQIVKLAMAPFDGAWSIDVAALRTGGFVVTDMAEMDRSFHWAGCPNGIKP